LNAAFRVDASAAMGVGHLSRCLCLAEALRARGCDSRFISREHEGHGLAQIERAGMRLSVLAAPLALKAGGAEDYAAWLGVTQDQDAAQSVKALGGERPAWLVVDHYGLDAGWERLLCPHTERLMAIDDLANRTHDCDLLLDQNISASMDERYTGIVPADCRLLLGPRYALLGADYARHRLHERRRDTGVETVFVFFGGSDPDNLTGAALAALELPALRHLKVDIVVGANNAHRLELQTRAAARPGTAVYGPRPHLADLMSRADLAIGAAGTTTWERMCVGLPSLVVSIAENQRRGAEAMAADGLIQYLGEAREVGSTELAGAIEGALAGKQALAEQSLRGRLLVDGLGALRAAECMDPTERKELQLREARAQDAELFFAWANEAQVRRQSLNSAQISWIDHHQWFRCKLRDSRSRMFVMEAKSLPVGQVRFDIAAGEARIDYSIDAAFRGRGWGRSLIAMGMRRLTEPERIIFRGDVKAANPASSAVFTRLGFHGSISQDRSGLTVFRFDSGLQTLPEIE
jgi:UDP-2,4-diacetamido-2,4,6-trideoxy-beta-L-altropyranose hydrolase